MFSLEVLFTPFSLVGGWSDSTNLVAGSSCSPALCEPGFLDSIVDWRAMTPDVYERDFHLPAGHATSFAGGPLAAFRNPNPELTKYETAVVGPLPHGRRDVPRRRRLGRERSATAPRVILEQRVLNAELVRNGRALGGVAEGMAIGSTRTPGSLALGRYAGIPVRAHWSMALIVVLFGTSLAGSLGLTGGIVATLAFFASIVAHEFGHALVARRYGVETESIDLWLLGGVAQLDREAPTPRADGLIAVAGPAVSLLIGVVAFGLGVALDSVILGWIGVVNLLAGGVQHAARVRRSTVAGCSGRGVGRGPGAATGRCATPATPDGCSGGVWPASASP